MPPCPCSCPQQSIRSPVLIGARFVPARPCPRPWPRHYTWWQSIRSPVLIGARFVPVPVPIPVPVPVPVPVPCKAFVARSLSVLALLSLSPKPSQPSPYRCSLRMPPCPRCCPFQQSIRSPVLIGARFASVPVPVQAVPILGGKAFIARSLQQSRYF
jgi:hypothetical protein